uniref:Ankyrin repeat and SOCS box protein 11 n=1 Tax=Electrophorus electricus TaxID=8005 RepID=A0A4W4GPM6_ELEEL
SVGGYLHDKWWEVQYYVGVGVRVHVPGSWADRTPLHDAALQGRLLPVKRLLSQVQKRQRFVNRWNVWSGLYIVTPLFNACCSGNPTLLGLLLMYSSAHHPAHLLRSPIHEAAKRGYTACVEVLLSHGVNADIHLAGMGTPLYCACETRRLDCVRRLLILGADVHCGHGLDTPLHAAVRACGVMEVELLLEHGADVKCRNSEDKTPLDMATDNYIKHLLQTAGPCSLSHLSRLCIRRTLGQKRLSRAKMLCLPHILINYVLYQ